MVCKIIGVGGHVPGKPVSNDELAKIVTDSDSEWVKSRTGIMYRHFAEPNVYSSHMAFEASKDALDDSGISAQDIDLIIVCTTTPDNSMPSVATKLQGYLGAGKAAAFDLQAVCAGFIYGLEVAYAMMKTGKYRNILLVGVDRMSSILDMNDRATAVLFGDGAGAVILSKDESIKEDSIFTNIYSDGSLWELLYTDGGVGSDGRGGVIKMNGKEIYRHAVEKMTSSMLVLLATHNVDISEVAYIIPHQANLRIIDSIASRINFPEERVIKTISKYANNSAATIPLALKELELSGNLKRGDLILMTALGGGLTWGSALVRW
jgi:3-oxoacyl-[acyl-carrier-protein] synthase III